MRFTRDFYIPKNPTDVIKRPELQAEVYIVDVANKHFALGFSGRRAKPDFHYRFEDPGKRAAYVQRYFESKESMLESKAQDKLKRAEATQQFLESLRPGVILYDTWGYEQTNVEFYVVLKRESNRVLIQELYPKSVPGSESSWASDRVVPSHEIKGVPVWKTVRGPSIRIDDCISLRLWPKEYEKNGVHRSWYA